MTYDNAAKVIRSAFNEITGGNAFAAKVSSNHDKAVVVALSDDKAVGRLELQAANVIMAARYNKA